MKNGLASQKIKKQQNLLQIEHYRQDLEYEVEVNKHQIRSQINKMFDEIINQVNFTRNEWLNKAEKEFDTYDTKLKLALAKLDKIEESINCDISFIDFLSQDKNFKQHDFKDVHNIGSITDYYATVINQWKKNTADLIGKVPFIDSKLCFETDQKARLKLSEGLSDCYSLVIENKLKNLVNKKINECFNISKWWFCPTCRTKNNQETNDLECSEWKVYKPIELYESFFNNKRYATFNDIKLLQKRKEMEKESILEKNKSNTDEVKTYFFIDENWIKSWEIFALSKTVEYNLQSVYSCNEIFYTPCPGPITNHLLLNADSSIRDDISITSFRIVNPKVWNHLYFIYKGGPEIHRAKPSVYSPAADKNTIGDEMRSKISEIAISNSQKSKLILELKEKSKDAKRTCLQLKKKHDSLVQVLHPDDSVNSQDSIKTDDEDKEIEANSAELKYVIAAVTWDSK